jgi:hypothetical protein
MALISIIFIAAQSQQFLYIVLISVLNKSCLSKIMLQYFTIEDEQTNKLFCWKEPAVREIKKKPSKE